MEDFGAYSRSVVRELSCRLCLCTDVTKLKALSPELKRKLKKMFNIDVRSDDNLPKAICHDCLQQIGTTHRYAVRVERTQNFLKFYHLKNVNICKKVSPTTLRSELSPAKIQNEIPNPVTPSVSATSESPVQEPVEIQAVISLPKPKCKSKPPTVKRVHREALSLEEFILKENVDKTIFLDSESADPPYWKTKTATSKPSMPKNSTVNEVLDPIVLVNGKANKQGQELDNQISLFYDMECLVCHETDFDFKSLMKHYKDKHGVPGYVTCCDKKFHYFYPKKIIEHMAYHLQPNIFMCESCHENFQSSQELAEHRAHGGRSEGQLLCRRCHERYPTWRELGLHLTRHRALYGDAAAGGVEEGKLQQCDYCGKWLKHRHRKKKVNGMEDLILCTPCVRTLRSIEKHSKDPMNSDVKESVIPKPLCYTPFNPGKHRQMKRSKVTRSEGDVLQE